MFWKGKKEGPEAQVKPKISVETIYEPPTTPRNRFEVQGTYAFKGAFMVNGKVLSGKIEKGMQTEYAAKEACVNEIQYQNKGANALEAGQTGSLWIDKILAAYVKQGDILDFE